MTRLAMTFILCGLPPLLLLASVAEACPTCKDGVAMEAGAGVVSGGFNTSIYLMLGGLACVGGFVGRLVVKAARATPTGGD